MSAYIVYVVITAFTLTLISQFRLWCGLIVSSLAAENLHHSYMSLNCMIYDIYPFVYKFRVTLVSSNAMIILEGKEMFGICSRKPLGLKSVKKLVARFCILGSRAM